MGHSTESKERDALYEQLQNEAASLDTIHEMLGSGKWTMNFDESGAMTSVNWSDEFRRMLGYHDQEDFPDVLESWSNLLHPDNKERVRRGKRKGRGNDVHRDHHADASQSRSERVG